MICTFGKGRPKLSVLLVLGPHVRLQLNIDESLKSHRDLYHSSHETVCKGKPNHATQGSSPTSDPSSQPSSSIKLCDPSHHRRELQLSLFSRSVLLPLTSNFMLSSQHSVSSYRLQLKKNPCVICAIYCFLSIICIKVKLFV